MPRSQLDVEAMAEGVFASVKSFLERFLTPLRARLEAVEKRAPEKGEKGDAGEKGEQGDPGVAGEKGEQGPQGPEGQRGEKGEPGQDGKEGPPGLAGEVGPEGPAGRDGRDGLPGLNGKDGAPGEKGADGRDGKDGLGFDHLEAVHDGERTVTLRFVCGEEVKEFPIKFDVVLDRGVWTERPFEKGDMVTWGGSAWIAQRDTGAKPETNDDWRLAVRRGRDGKQGPMGPQGERGLQGPTGKDGRSY